MTVNIHGVDLVAYADIYKDAYGYRPRVGSADSITMEMFDRVCKASDEAINSLVSEQEEWTKHASEVMGRPVTYKELCNIADSGGREYDTALNLLVSYPC